ncbi:halovibrin HvnA [Vibrio sp. NTOU-M3]|uniref:halovibrin HvnA n=1 Tax=Vibrio sp. NTOU-M3 TaxID=3234954 RepID=UPI00349F8701
MSKLANNIIISFLWLLPATVFAQDLISQRQGDSLVAALSKDYYETNQHCGGRGRPAFLCSGITFRGGVPGDYYIWNPSPNSERSGGVSFSYLRTDSKYRRLAYNYKSGYTVYQVFGGPRDKVDLDYLCFYPVDAATNQREDSGCGKNRPYPETSLSCDEQGVFTAEQWYAQTYNLQGVNKRQTQCGFNVKEGVRNTASNFYEGIRAMHLLGNESFALQNEIRIKTWPQGIGSSLPIQSFFYTRRSGDAGRLEAQSYQKDFYEVTGIAIPVIKISLPQTIDQDAKFEFSMNDQAINNL